MLPLNFFDSVKVATRGVLPIDFHQQFLPGTSAHKASLDMLALQEMMLKEFTSEVTWGHFRGVADKLVKLEAARRADESN